MEILLTVPLPEFLLQGLEQLLDWILYARTWGYEIGTFFYGFWVSYYSRFQAILGQDRAVRALPLIIFLIIFWPVILSFIMIFSTASTWVFWIVTSVFLGIAQVVYVTYHFLMIVIDILGLSILKTYTVFRAKALYYLGDNKLLANIRRTERMEWKRRLEHAGNYENFLKIPIAKRHHDSNDSNKKKKKKKTSSSSSSSTLSTSTSSSSLSSLPIMSSLSAESSSSSTPTSRGVQRSNSSGALILSPTNEHSNSGAGAGGSPGRIKKNRSFSNFLDDFSEPSSSPQRSNSEFSSGAAGLLEGEIDADIIDELGEMTTVMLMTTKARLKEARQAASKDENSVEAASSLKALLSGVVKRNHLTIENLMIKNARSVAASGQYGLSGKARNMIYGHFEEVEKGLDWIAEAPIPAAEVTTNISLPFRNINGGSHSRNMSISGSSLMSGDRANDIVEEDEEEHDYEDEKNKKNGNKETNSTDDNDVGDITFDGDDQSQGGFSGTAFSNLNTSEISERMTLVRKMKQNMGRTALMLSGGGAQAMYHLGTIRALVESKVYDDITVISGTSGGSISAAMCAIKSSEELLRDVCVPTISTDYLLNGEMKKQNIRWFPKVTDMCAYWFKTKLMVDSALFRRTCEFYYSDITFEEAFERTGKHVCITVSASRASGDTAQRLLLNHISTPHVTLASAVAASCALPGVMAPAKLMSKNSGTGELEPFMVDGVEWIDGSVQADLPFQRISTLFNVSNFVVCQTNFHVLPFLNKAHHPNQQSLYWRLFQLLEWDIRNRALQLSRLGLFPRVFGQDVSKVFKQKYHGNLTIVPRFTPAQTFGLKALVNPTVDDMKGYLKYGQMAAWPYLNVIRDMVRLEKALDHCLARLQDRFRDLYPDFGNDDIESIASSSLPSTSVLHASNRVRFVGRENNEAEKYRQKMVTLENENNTLKQQILQLQKLLEKSNDDNSNKNNGISNMATGGTPDDENINLSRSGGSPDIDADEKNGSDEEETKRRDTLKASNAEAKSKAFREPLSEGEVWSILVSNRR